MKMMLWLVEIIMNKSVSANSEKKAKQKTNFMSSLWQIIPDLSPSYFLNITMIKWWWWRWRCVVLLLDPCFVRAPTDVVFFGLTFHAFVTLIPLKFSPSHTQHTQLDSLLRSSHQLSSGNYSLPRILQDPFSLCFFPILITSGHNEWVMTMIKFHNESSEQRQLWLEWATKDSCCEQVMGEMKILWIIFQLNFVRRHLMAFSRLHTSFLPQLNCMNFQKISRFFLHEFTSRAQHTPWW